MERIQLGQTGIESSRLIYGCMRLTESDAVSPLIRVRPPPPSVTDGPRGV